ncbi:MAG TPA: hypothetical protein VFK84_03480 [Burkholderiales bacterium]|nr:hypothetical protein [Burkholderiales bacterium]
MSIYKRWRFTEGMVKDAPDCAGVYVLWSDSAALSVGEAAGRGDTIRSRLLGCLGLDEVTHYSWEITRAPQARAMEIARELRAGVAETQSEA